MDADSGLEKDKPLVIFYDCCVPKRQFARVMRKTILFADHIFAREVFSEEDCDPDYHLFSKVEEKRRAEYPDKICLFITQDKKDFIDRVKRHPAYNVTIKVIRIEHCNTVELNWIRAGETASSLVSGFAEVLEQKSKRGRAPLNYIFGILERNFRKKTV